MVVVTRHALLIMEFSNYTLYRKKRAGAELKQSSMYFSHYWCRKCDNFAAFSRCRISERKIPFRAFRTVNIWSFCCVQDPDMFWDFISLMPMTTHQVMFLFSDRGTPDGFR
jgi:hypothetical protein